MKYRLRIKLKVTDIEMETEDKAEFDKVFEEEAHIKVLMEKARAINEYALPTPQVPVEATPIQAPAPAQPQPVAKPKSKYGKCPKCGRETVTTNTVKKEGPNKGKKFNSCFHTDRQTQEKCGYFEWC